MPQRQMTTESNTLRPKLRKLPASSKLKFSKENVENVEKPPQNPVIKNNFCRSESISFPDIPNKSPSMKLAKKLALRVANGKT